MNVSKFVACSVLHPIPLPVGSHSRSNVSDNITELVDEISGFSDNESEPKRRSRHKTKIRSTSRSHSKITRKTAKKTGYSSNRKSKQDKHRKKHKYADKKLTKPKYVVNTLYGDFDPLALSSDNLERYLTVKQEKIQRQLEIEVSSDNSQCEYDYYRFCPDSSQKLVPINNQEHTEEQHSSQSDIIKSSPLFNTSQDFQDVVPDAPLTHNNISKFLVKKETNTITNKCTDQTNAQQTNQSSVMRFTIRSAIRESSLTKI